MNPMSGPDSSRIVLVQPMYSRQELNGDSNYVLYSQSVRAMLRLRPKWHFIVIFPDAASGYKYEDDGFFKLPNVTRVSQRVSSRKMANAISFDAIWYDKFARIYGVDLVWNNLVEIGGYLAAMGTGTYVHKARPMVVNTHHYVIHPTLPYPFEPQEAVALAQLTGSLGADHNVFSTEYCEWLFTDLAGRYFQQDVIDRIMAKSSRITHGPLDGTLSPVDQQTDVPLILYNHRLQQYKDYRTTFELLDELHREGVPFKVIFTSATAENTSRIVHYPFVEVRLCATHEDYLKVARTCHLNTTNSLHETFCISAVESMAMGQPLVAPDGITFPEITDRDTLRYPYLFKSRDQQKGMLRKLLLDAGERAKWGTILSESVTRRYHREVGVEKYAQLFERLTDFPLGTAEDSKQFVLEGLAEYNGRPMKELHRSLIGKTVNGRTPFGSQSLTPTKLARLVRELGGRVEMVNGEQRAFVR